MMSAAPPSLPFPPLPCRPPGNIFCDLDKPHQRVAHVANLVVNLLLPFALILARMYPVVPGAFRRAVRDVHFNGYLIPAGTRISWNVLGGYRSERLYPESKK